MVPYCLGAAPDERHYSLAKNQQQQTKLIIFIHSKKKGRFSYGGIDQPQEATTATKSVPIKAFFLGALEDGKRFIIISLGFLEF